MTVSLNELSSVYREFISEEDSTPEAVAQRVAQMVKAIRYRARKEASPLSKAFNDYIGSVNATSVERQAVKEKLGLTGGTVHKEEYVDEAKNVHGDIEVPKKNLGKLVKKAVKRIDTDVDGDVDKNDPSAGEFGEFVPKPNGKGRVYTGSKKVRNESFSNWRQDLSEVMDEVEASKEIKEKKVKNKVVINPPMKEAFEEIGGTILEVVEVEQIDEKALSKAQQRFMGMVYAVKQGKMKAPSAEVAKAASSMTGKEAKDFAKTKHKGLPEKKEVKEGTTEMPMSPQELSLQRKKTAIDMMIAKKRQQALQKAGNSMKESAEDRLRDRRMERGGVDGNTRYDRPPAKKLSNAELGIKPGKTQVQKDAEKKYGKGASAMDIVKAEIRAKHGNGAM